jgi:hypothetical protein
MNYKIKKLFAIGLVITMSARVGNKLSLSSQADTLLSVKTDLRGYKIAFGDTRDIYMMNPDGSDVEKLADAGPISGYVSWSEDASYVYFASAKGSAESAWEAYRVNVRTRKVTKITDFGNDVRSLGVSPDGKTLAISVMTGNSSIGNNNDNLTQFTSNLYVVPMELVERKIQEGKMIIMDDMTAIQFSDPKEHFWYEELCWNHDASNPILAYTKTWRYDEDDVSYTHTYTIKPDGSENTLIAKNCDQPIWSFDSSRLSFLGLNYIDLSNMKMEQFNVKGINNEVSGGSYSPQGNQYMVFEIGDENRKAGIVNTIDGRNVGVQLPTKVDVYEPRWSPIPVL